MSKKCCLVICTASMMGVFLIEIFSSNYKFSAGYAEFLEMSFALLFKLYLTASGINLMQVCRQFQASALTIRSIHYKMTDV